MLRLTHRKGETLTKKLVLAVAMAMVGAGLMVAAATASSTAKAKPAKANSHHAKTGGTLKTELNSDLDYADPQLDYYQPGWEMQYATEVKLFNFPDKNGAAGKQLVPEGAAGFPIISKNGRTYTFKIRPGFRFSPPSGQPVTAVPVTGKEPARVEGDTGGQGGHEQLGRGRRTVLPAGIGRLINHKPVPAHRHLISLPSDPPGLHFLAIPGTGRWCRYLRLRHIHPPR